MVDIREDVHLGTMGHGDSQNDVVPEVTPGCIAAEDSLTLSAEIPPQQRLRSRWSFDGFIELGDFDKEHGDHGRSECMVPAGNAVAFDTPLEPYQFTDDPSDPPLLGHISHLLEDDDSLSMLVEIEGNISTSPHCMEDLLDNCSLEFQSSRVDSDREFDLTEVVPPTPATWLREAAKLEEDHRRSRGQPTRKRKRPSRFDDRDTDTQPSALRQSQPTKPASTLGTGAMSPVPPEMTNQRPQRRRSGTVAGTGTLLEGGRRKSRAARQMEEATVAPSPSKPHLGGCCDEKPGGKRGPPAVVVAGAAVPGVVAGEPASKRKKVDVDELKHQVAELLLQQQLIKSGVFKPLPAAKAEKVCAMSCIGLLYRRK
ncbi:unnamed protein product [Discosporangium mesarthrocarpum]